MRNRFNGALAYGVALTMCAFILGYLGYRHMAGVSMSRSDAVFKALQLFTVEAIDPPQGAPLSWNIARFLAPFALAFATFATVVALLREQVQALLVTWFARNHVVLIGLGRSSAMVGMALRRDGVPVVVIEAGASNERLAALRGAGGRVLIGDGSDPAMLLQARVGRARHIVVSTGDDSRNLEVADSVVRALGGGAARRGTLVHVAVDDPLLWCELGRLELARARDGVLLEFYNGVDRAAQALVTELEHHPGPMAGEFRVHGDGPLLERTLIHLVRRAALNGIRPEILLTSDDAGSVEAMLAREGWLGEAAAITVQASFEANASVGVVCSSSDDATSIARGLALAKIDQDAQVFVAVAGLEDGGFLRSVGAGANVRLVPVNVRAFSEDFLSQSGPELMARIRHEEYVAGERARGVSESENPSLVPWESLPESLRESNRRFAESVGEILGAVGGRLVPVRQLMPDGSFVGAEVLESLAIDEHDRWMSALVSDGWTYAAGPKDPQLKTHPLLVPWADLAEEEREKDRVAIRSLPRMLARVGFAIELV